MEGCSTVNTFELSLIDFAFGLECQVLSLIINSAALDHWELLLCMLYTVWEIWGVTNWYQSTSLSELGDQDWA